MPTSLTRRKSQETRQVANNNGSSSSFRLFLMVIIAICFLISAYVNIAHGGHPSLMMMSDTAMYQTMEEFKNGFTKRYKAFSELNENLHIAEPPREAPEENPSKDDVSPSKNQQIAASQNKNSGLASSGISEIANLKCGKHGGPPDEFAQEMVYWEDIPSDAKYVSPLKQKVGSQRHYMTFEPDGGGWNNIRMAMETVVGLAAATGRTLVLPPQKKMYLLGKQDKQQKAHFGFEDFFPMQKMAQENAAIDMITMKEFLEAEAVTGKLKNKETGEVSWSPHNRTEWNGCSPDEWDELREWLRTVTLVPQWKPEVCLATFPANGNHKSVQEVEEMQKAITGQRINPDQYKGNPVPVDAPPLERMKEQLNNRKQVCIYDEKMQHEPVVHFACAHKLKLRLLVHFYAFIFMEDWKEDLWMKRFMRDHMRYNDDIQCAAARVVHAMRSIARERDPKGNPEGLFDTFHVRRGDFQYRNTRISAEEIYENTKDQLKPNTTIFIATDERDKSFFDPLRKHYAIYTLDDFMHTLEGVNTNYFGMIDQLVASRGNIFFGCWFSTFTGFINRMRGYRSVKDKLPGYEQGALPTSFYYAMLDRKFVMHEYVPLSGSFFAREFATSWRDIDKGLDLMASAMA